MRLLPLLLFLLFSNSLLAQKFASNTLVLKLKAEFQDQIQSGEFQSEDLKAFAGSIQISSIEPIFPQHRAAAREVHPLSTIYSLEYDSKYPQAKLVRYLLSKNIFEYVEPKTIPQVVFTPNDPLFTQQNHLDSIFAPDAWDISTSSGNQVIAIIDTGVEDDHPDLQTKIFVNLADPINGQDDDNDGFIDNNLGWNFVNKNGNVAYTDSDHGVHVAGIAGAATNNGQGVAGVGFDTKLMILKAGNRLDITNGYEAIVYAADHGADVINCSWGEYYPSYLAKDALEYAVSKGSVVVAAAGNDGDPDPFYPAAFPEVIAVAALNEDGGKAGISNFGNWIDIGAPGVQIRSTVGGKGYNANSGTSMSAPMVSGVLALLKDYRPNLTSEELKAVVINTADDKYNLPINTPWAAWLGSGRLNALKALQMADSATLRLSDYQLSDEGDNWFAPGDTIQLFLEIEALVSGSDFIYVESSVQDTNVYVQSQSSSLFGNTSPGQKVDNLGLEHSFVLGDYVPVNHNLRIEVRFANQVDTFRKWIEIPLNTSYINVEENKLKLTYTSQGLVGYNRYSELEGDGFSFEGGVSLLYEGGFAVGFKRNGENIVLDRLRGFNDVGETEWRSTEFVRRDPSSPACSNYASGSFQDQLNYDIAVDQRSWVCNSEGLDQSIFLEYVVHNNSTEDYFDVYGAMFTDYDIGDFELNKGNFDGQRFLSYTYSKEPEDSGLYLGLQLIEPDIYKTYFISHEEGGEGGVDLVDDDVFISDEKYEVMQGGKLSAGLTSSTDVFQEVSSGPYTLAFGDSLKFVFCMLVGKSLEELQERADSSYASVRGELPANRNQIRISEGAELWPNPFSNELHLRLSEEGPLVFSVFDLLGKELYSYKSAQADKMSFDLNFLEQGVYIIELKTADGIERRKMLHSQTNYEDGS